MNFNNMKQGPKLPGFFYPQENHRNLTIDIWRLDAGGTGLPVTPEYQAIIDYALSQGYGIPSDTIQEIQNTLIKEMKEMNIWNDLDVFYNFLGDGDHNFARINWKNPGTFTAVGSPTYIPFQGFKANGVNQILDFGINLQALTGYQLNDASYGFDVIQPNQAVSVSLFGTAPNFTGGDPVTWYAQLLNGAGRSSINSLAAPVWNPFIYSGLWQVQRVNALQSTSWRNGQKLPDVASPSTSIPSGSPLLFAVRNGAGPTNFSDAQINCLWIGASLAGKEFDLSKAWFDYKANVANFLYTDEYVAILQYAFDQGYTYPTADVRREQDKLIQVLIADGIWDDLDVFYNFVGDGDADFAKINWKNPGTFQAVGGNAPYQQMTGVVGPADWTVMPPNQATIAQPENVASFIGISNYQFAVDNITSGVSVNNEAVRARSATEVRLRVNTIYNSVGIPVQSGGDYFLMGQGSGAIGRFFNNGIEVGNVGGAPPGIEQGSFVINSSLGTVASLITQVYGRGASLQGREQNLYTGWNNYKISIEALVAYRAILSYATSQGFALPTQSVQSAQLRLIGSLIEAGIWDELDLFYNFFTNGDAGFARINWKNPGVNQTVGGTFTPLVGMLGSPALNNGYVPGTGNYLLDNASAFFDLTTFSDSLVSVFNNANLLVALPANLVNFFQFRINDTNTFNAPPVLHPVNSDFVQIQRRVTQNQKRAFKNGLLLGEVQSTPTTLPVNLNLFVSTQISYKVYGAGASLEGKEAALNAAWQGYKVEAMLFNAK